MKKIVMTIRLVLISLLANASHQASQLSLEAAENRTFSVSFDQSPFSNRGKSVILYRIEPGYHYLYVVSYSRFPFRPPVAGVLFSNYVYIPASSKIAANIACNHSFDVLSIVPLCNPPFPYQEPVSYNYSHDNAYATMCDDDFAQLKNVIASKAFESSKLQIAGQAISSHRLLTSLIAELMQLMSFESSRLELAKTAYSHTVDRQNYYLVNDSFFFESSIRELDRFIRYNS